MKIGWFFIDISGCISSFGPALCVVRESAVVLQWIAAGSSGESMRESLGELKVTSMHGIIMDFSIWGRLTMPRGPLRAQGSALTRDVARFHFGRATQPRPQGFQHCSSVGYLRSADSSCRGVLCSFVHRGTHNIMFLSDDSSSFSFWCCAASSILGNIREVVDYILCLIRLN